MGMSIRQYKVKILMVKKESYWIPLPVKRMEPETGLDLGDASGFMGFPAFNQKDLNDKNDRDNMEQSY